MKDDAQVDPFSAVAKIEVSAKRTRRRFTAKDKKAILEEADKCSKMGELGALLRRKGLYSSSLARWREERERGEMDGLAPKKRGPSFRPENPAERVNEELKRALAKSEARAKRAEAMIEVQKNDLARPAPSVAPETPLLLRYASREERPSAFWCS
jgi:transposase-like protein